MRSRLCSRRGGGVDHRLSLISLLSTRAPVAPSNPHHSFHHDSSREGWRIRNWSEAARYSSSELIRARFAASRRTPATSRCSNLPTSSGIRERASIRSKLISPLAKASLQIRTVDGASHGPDQGFRSIRMDIQSGGRPFRKGTAPIGRSDLPVVELFEHRHLLPARRDLSDSSAINSRSSSSVVQIYIPYPEHTFEVGQKQEVRRQTEDFLRSRSLAG